MQIIKEAASLILMWETVQLLNGAYRVQKARILEEVPDLTEFIDCSYCYRFIDELSCVRQMLSVGVRTHGVWVGMMKNGEPTDVVGVYVECETPGKKIPSLRGSR